MATEVSCGQCNGRLLVETLGVVVACPHCGVHLSIPHPDPIPAPTPQIFVEPPSVPTPEPVPIPVPPDVIPAPTAPVTSELPQPQIVFESPAEPNLEEMTPNDFAALATTGALLAPNPPSTGASSDDLHSSNVLGEPEEHPTTGDRLGWASAPNLFLSADSPSPSPDTLIGSTVQVFPEVNATIAQTPVEACPPASEPVEPPASVEGTVPEKSSWTFHAAPEPVQPAMELASAPVPPETAPPLETFKFSAPGLLPGDPQSDVPSPQQGLQFTAAPVVEEKLETSAPPPATENRLVFMPAPAASLSPVSTVTPASPPISAPVGGSVAPTLVFTAAAPSAPTFQQTMTVPPSPQTSSAPAPPPLVFGAAPLSVTPVSLPGRAEETIPSSTVAEDVANYAENEAAQRQRLLLMLLFIVGSYASAVSIVLVYLLVFGGASELESLPDLVPPKRANSNNPGWSYFPPKANVAPWHTLQLGQSRRFGSVKVTPVKVTRGPVQFEHFTDRAANRRDPSNSVLKLWVKFENVSSDQTFAPLDSHLLFLRDSKDLGQKVSANSFVAIEAERKKGKLAAFLYEMSVESEFRMVGQNLGKELAPGDSLLTYIPSEEEAANLNGDMVWRFQIRKGYNRKSYRGVTTLIDVRFKSSDVTGDVST